MYRREFLKGAAVAVVATSIPIFTMELIPEEAYRPPLPPAPAVGTVFERLSQFHLYYDGPEMSSYWDLTRTGPIRNLLYGTRIGRGGFQSCMLSPWDEIVFPPGFGYQVKCGEGVRWSMVLADNHGLYVRTHQGKAHRLSLT